jgi:hypothetical protein
LNAFCPEFEPVPEDKVGPDRHPGVEFLYVISGKSEPIITACGRTGAAG